MSVRPGQGLDLSAFGLTPETYWSHCVTVLTFAEEMASKKVARFGENFSTAALLHDFGKLVLSEHLTPEHRELLRQGTSGCSMVEHESRVLSVNHAEVTAVVTQSWDLPEDLVKAVQYHHSPAEFDHPMCHGLNIPNQLAWRLESRAAQLEQESESLAVSMSALGMTSEKLNSVLHDGSVRLEETMEIYS
ncbi:MAG: HDOD domain-containing protein [Fuerstiella sp.]|nr:HDOD domain-containing protein [Fuerstiella sp.]